MSRGLGTRQRVILDALTRHPDGMYLSAALEPGYAEAEYQAAYRAAYQLERRGLIRLQRFTCGREKLVVYPCDSTSMTRPCKR